MRFIIKQIDADTESVDDNIFFFCFKKTLVNVIAIQLLIRLSRYS